MISKPSMDEGAARFWTTIFGGITAISLVAAGLYSLVQYFDVKQKDSENRDKDRATLKLQIATTRLAAKQAFNSKHLEFCAEAAGDAGTLASSTDKNKKRLAEDDFWRLYWGPLGIVEESEVASAMVAFGRCLQGSCGGKSATSLAIALARACRTEVSKDFEIDLPTVGERPAAIESRR